MDGNLVEQFAGFLRLLCWKILYVLEIKNMSGKLSVLRLPSPLRIGAGALLLALACMLLNPLSALACGGLFSKDMHTEQSGERLIYTVDPGKVTLYEQFTYTGAPKDFVWVLPV